MTAGTLAAMERALSSGKTVGGGALMVPERLSAGIAATFLMLLPLILKYRVTGRLFWCRRRDFEAIGGFREEFVSLEDFDFARRLKAHGQRVGRPFRTLRGGHIVTSCRKFDRFGDWYLLKNPLFTWRLMGGRNRRAADHFYYDFEH